MKSILFVVCFNTYKVCYKFVTDFTRPKRENVFGWRGLRDYVLVDLLVTV